MIDLSLDIKLRYKNIGTYSEYKAKNCFTGGVFTQLSGWHGAFDLWTGRVAPDFTKAWRRAKLAESE
jgi:hypothetical protein